MCFPQKKYTTGADINSEGFQSCKYELALNVVIHTYLQMKDTSASIPMSLYSSFTFLSYLHFCQFSFLLSYHVIPLFLQNIQDFVYKMFCLSLKEVKIILRQNIQTNYENNYSTKYLMQCCYPNKLIC